jgi:hypothetical protein
VFSDSERKKELNGVGTTFFIKDANTLIIVTDGAFFELTRQATQTVANLTEIKSFLGKSRSFISKTYKDQYKVQSGYDGIETYSFPIKGINLYFKNDLVETVQVISPLVDINGTTLDFTEKQIGKKFEGVKNAKFGPNEPMNSTNSTTYYLQNIEITYHFNNGAIYYIWITDKSNLTKSEANNGKNILGKNGQTLIPKGWLPSPEIITGKPLKVSGDLNKDGISDVAMIIEKDTKEIEQKNRSILIAFGNKDSTYTLSVISKNPILQANEGGIFGDPLESIAIDKGTLLIKHYGGSNWRWYKSHRFRYQDNAFYLIGATEGSYNSGTTLPENADEEDYNLLTGDFTIRKADSNGVLQTTKGNRGKKPLVKLDEFKPQSEVKQY